MNTVLRLRWLVLLGYGLCVAVLFAVPASFGDRGLIYAALYGAGFGIAGALGYRRQGITVIDEGLLLKRSYSGGLFCQWSEVVAVERRQLGPFALDQLLLRQPVRRYTRGNATGPPEFTWRPTSSKRVFIGLYDKNWRTGPIGRAMTAHGASLDPVTPATDQS